MAEALNGHLSAQELADLANQRLRNAKVYIEVSNSVVNRYRASGIIPSGLWEEKTRFAGLKTYFHYKAAAADWIALGRRIQAENQPSAVEAILGRIFQAWVERFGKDEDSLKSLTQLYQVDKNYACFVRRLLDLGLTLPSDIVRDAAPPAQCSE